MKVTVKHGKKKYKAVAIESEESLEEFQAKLFSLTQVPVDRMKLICKGKQIESDSDLQAIKNKSVILLMGSAESGVSATADDSAVKFVEDMTAAQRQEANAELPPGLENLGNTCYLNSTLQALKAVPQLKDALKQQDSTNPTLSGEMGKLFREMDGTTDSVEPRDFVSFFRQRFPRFASRNEAGVWEQQDADECYTEIMNCLRNELRIENVNDNWVDRLFGGTFDTTLECTESTDEPIVSETESFDRLRCFIDTETRHINDGVVKSMSETLEKNSEKLGRNAIWQKKRAISKLPQYLTIQLVRFFWKAKQQKNAKVLRSVIFPEKLDVYEFCNSDLKAAIGKYRKLKLEKEDTEREKRQSSKMDTDDNKNDSNTDNNNNDSNNNDNNDNNATDNNAESANVETEEKKSDDAMDVDALETGYYELVGLVTHKGLASNSGHYIGYAKDDKRGWVKFDDETVTEVSSDDIKKLYGGGQWQMGYMTIFRRVDASDV